MNRCCNTVLKLVVYLLPLSVLWCQLPAQIYASENGIDGFSTSPRVNDGVSCLACHTQANNQSAAVEITGPAVVDANTINEYVVTLTGGPAKTAGVDIAVDYYDGVLNSVNDDLRKSEQDLTHRRPKSMVNGEVQFRFKWVAPSYNASTTVYAAASSSNGEFDLGGDAVASSHLQVRVQNGTGTRPDQPEPPVSLIKLETVASGLGGAISIANAGDRRMFVVERFGRIRLIDSDGVVQQQPFLDIAGRVASAAGEQGLLGLAFDPQFAQNGYFYVHYTRTGNNGSAFRGRVSRFRVSSDPRFADDNSEKVLLEIHKSTVTHNGGDLRFGKDGYLYISSGDGGEHSQVQNPNSLLGKILRIDVSAPPNDSNRPDCGYSPATTYRIPPGNAFRNGPGNGCDEIFVQGLRNPWRISLDRETGDLWIGDVGKESQEEVNYVKTTDGGGINLGWPCYEGNMLFDAAACRGVYIKPAYAYGRAVGRAVVGGYVYRGTGIPSLRGRYLFTDYGNSSKIYSLVAQSDRWVVQTVLRNSGKSLLSSFGEDASGELYVLSASAGELYRIVDGQSDGGARFHVSSVSVSENQSEASVFVRLTQPLQVASRVSASTYGGSATEGVDFYGVFKTVNLPAGTLSAKLSIPIINDAIVESDETLSVRLFRPIGAEIGTETARITIEDDDGSGTRPTLNLGSMQIDESIGTARLQAVLTTPATEVVSFSYTNNTSGTAVAGTDYYGRAGQQSIQPGQQVVEIPIQIVNDSTVEPTEYFFVNLDNVEGAVPGVVSARIDIVDDDR